MGRINKKDLISYFFWLSGLLRIGYDGINYKPVDNNKYTTTIGIEETLCAIRQDALNWEKLSIFFYDQYLNIQKYFI